MTSHRSITILDIPSIHFHPRRLSYLSNNLETAADYTDNREINERPISDYQDVNHKIAEMATKLDAAHLLNTRAVRILDNGGISADRMEGRWRSSTETNWPRRSPTPVSRSWA